MDTRGFALIATETAFPRAGRIGSRGALYALLLVSAAAVYAARQAFGAKLPFSPLYLQIPAYLLLAGLAAWQVRARLTAFRYTLTDEALLVERLGGGGSRLLARIPLSAFIPDGARPSGRLSAYVGRRRRAGALYFRQDGRARLLLHSMTEDMTARLWAARQENDGTDAMETGVL